MNPEEIAKELGTVVPVHGKDQNEDPPDWPSVPEQKSINLPDDFLKGDPESYPHYTVTESGAEYRTVDRSKKQPNGSTLNFTD